VIRVRASQGSAVGGHGGGRLGEPVAAVRCGADGDCGGNRREFAAGFECLPPLVVTVGRSQQGDVCDSDGAEDAVPVGADGSAEVGEPVSLVLVIAVVPGAVVPGAVVPGAVAAARESALCCEGEPMARLAMSPATTSNAAVADIGSHLLRGLWCCVVGCVAFTGAPSSDRIPCAG